jgi:hypothetical protein
LRIIEAILGGKRNPEQLAALCSTRIKASRQTIAKSLHGNWGEALLFCLKTAVETYRFSENKIQHRDNRTGSVLAQFAASLWSRSDQNSGHQGASSANHYFGDRSGYEPLENRETVRLLSGFMP